MRLVCPSCSATYRIDAASIGGQGRMVRCAGCGAEWFQAPAITDESLQPPLDPGAASPQQSPAHESAHNQNGNEPEPQPAAGEPVHDHGGYAQEPLAPPTPNPSYSEPVYDVSVGEARPAEYAPVYYEDEPQHQPAFGTASQTYIEDPLAEPSPALAQARDEPPARGGGGFLAGFSTVAVLAVIAAGVYVKAPALAEVAPAAEPALKTYVEMVNQGRVALAGLIG